MLPTQKDQSANVTFWLFAGSSVRVVLGCVGDKLGVTYNLVSGEISRDWGRLVTHRRTAPRMARR